MSKKEEMFKKLIERKVQGIITAIEEEKQEGLLTTRDVYIKLIRANDDMIKAAGYDFKKSRAGGILQKEINKQLKLIKKEKEEKKEKIKEARKRTEEGAKIMIARNLPTSDNNDDEEEIVLKERVPPGYTLEDKGKNLPPRGGGKRKTRKRKRKTKRKKKRKTKRLDEAQRRIQEERIAERRRILQVQARENARVMQIIARQREDRLRALRNEGSSGRGLGGGKRRKRRKTKKKSRRKLKKKH